MEIRALTGEDANAWRAVRARMLREHPEAFGEDIDDFLARDDAELSDRIRNGNVIGAWVGNELVGTVGWFAAKGRKRRHVAEIWGMYVTPESRRSGAGRALLHTAFEASTAAGISLWELGVEENNTGARKLYEAEGFVAWGVEPDAYRLETGSVNIIHMSRIAES